MNHDGGPRMHRVLMTLAEHGALDLHELTRRVDGHVNDLTKSRVIGAANNLTPMGYMAPRRRGAPYELTAHGITEAARRKALIEAGKSYVIPPHTTGRRASIEPPPTPPAMRGRPEWGFA